MNRALLAVCGATWLLVGVTAILAAAISVVGVASLPLVPGGFGWYATAMGAWLETGRISLLILLLLDGVLSLAVGLADLAVTDLGAHSTPTNAHAASGALATGNAIAGVGVALVARLTFSGDGTLLRRLL